MGRGQRGGGGGGSQNVQVSSTSESKSKEKAKKRKDFSVEIVFSSMPYYVYCGWKKELYVDKRKPNVAESPVLNMAWSSPKGNGYGPCDETIFIDCSLNNIKLFENGKEPNLTKYLGFAITRLKDLMYLRSKNDCYGTVNIKIVAIHPCQKCMFALSALLGTQLSDSGVYSKYVSSILSKDEFSFTFRWIQQMGWEMKVKYCALFDAYKSILEDTRGSEDREKEMKRIIDNHKSGEDTVIYAGKEVPYDYVKEEYRKLTDPTEKELAANYREQCKNVEEVEKDAARQKKQIDKAMNESMAPYKREKVEIENLRKSSPKYAHKSDAELSQILQSGGLIDFQHIKWGTEYRDQYGNKTSGGLEQAMNLDHGEDSHAPVYMVDGAPLDAISLENRRKEIDKQVADAKATRDMALKAYKDKQMAFTNSVLDALQLVATIGSLAFPPLALVDAAISVARWAGGPECSTTENVANGIGVAMDIAGVIPYFGPMIKLSGKAAKVATKETVRTIGKQTTKNVLKGLNQEVKDVAKHGTSLAGIGENLSLGSMKQLENFYKAQQIALPEGKTATELITTAYTLEIGIGYNGASFFTGLLEGFKFDPKIMAKKRKEVEKKRNEKPKYKDLSMKSEDMDGFAEYDKANKDLKEAQKTGDKEAIASAKRRQDAAERLAGAQMEIECRQGDDSIKDAQKKLDQARLEEKTAKEWLDRQQNHTAEIELQKLQTSGASNGNTAKRISDLKSEINYNYLYPDANRASYDQAVLNRIAAEQAVEDAKQNDYDATMARINKQIAIQDLNYEKSNTGK